MSWKPRRKKRKRGGGNGETGRRWCRQVPLNDNSSGSGENWIDRWQSGFACRQRRVAQVGARRKQEAESVRAAKNTFRDAGCSYARLLINLAYRVFGHELVCRPASCLSFDLTKVITNEFDIGGPGLGINVAEGSRFNRYRQNTVVPPRSTKTSRLDDGYRSSLFASFSCYTRAGIILENRESRSTVRKEIREKS